MAAKVLETVLGLVEQVNANKTGIKVSGQWLNISRFHTIADFPLPGQRASVQVEKTDRGDWIQLIEILDEGKVFPLPAPQRRGGGGRSPAELRDIRRLATLKAAAGFAASRPDMKSSDVLKVAAAWEQWVARD